MRVTLIFVLSAAFIGGPALAQISPPNSDPSNKPAANSAASNPTAATPKQPQPQGHPGSINTTSGGAPASSPQGDSPPGMQPHPSDRKQDAVPK